MGSHHGKFQFVSRAKPGLRAPGEDALLDLLSFTDPRPAPPRLHHARRVSRTDERRERGHKSASPMQLGQGYGQFGNPDRQLWPRLLSANLCGVRDSGQCSERHGALASRPAVASEGDTDGLVLVFLTGILCGRGYCPRAWHRCGPRGHRICFVNKAMSNCLKILGAYLLHHVGCCVGLTRWLGHCLRHHPHPKMMDLQGAW